MQTLIVTDGQTDGGGGGPCNISRPGPTAPAGDNKWKDIDKNTEHLLDI